MEGNSGVGAGLHREMHERNKLSELAKEQDLGVFFPLYFGVLVNWLFGLV